MRSYKMIVYPFGLAVGSLYMIVLLGMVMFGLNSADWEKWQNELVGTVGAFVGLAGAVVGLWVAIRSEERAAR
ncbi:MAG TPA: hypothetical protein VGK58_07940 [Lacipirellulaceae bacterium]